MILQGFIIGAIASFLGSIPPGTLNILVLQLGLENKLKAALRFSIAVALVEYPYTWIAVEFEGWITSSPVVQENFKLLAASVMVILGLLGLWAARKPSIITMKLQESGFRRGLLLSLLNPQGIPWWIGMTAYLKSQGWITIDTGLTLHSYLFGTAVGVLALLILVAFMAQRVSSLIQHSRLMTLLPSLVLLALGLVTFARIYLYA
ncbi:MAG: LysE family transporter [Cyclobacteriaceae bacterium]|nr:LysE family transporter [Cyclobacteriaceae bacterium]